MKLSEILKITDTRSEIRLIGNSELDIDGLNLCNRTSERNSVLSYAVSDRYIQNLIKASHVKALIVSADCADAYKEVMEQRGGTLIVNPKPETLFYDIHEALCKDGRFYGAGSFPARIGEGCSIHSTAVIEQGVVIGNNVKIGANSVILSGTVIEDNAAIGCNSTIGSEGFQIITEDTDEPRRITHCGGCRICENVCIGDNVTVSKSLFEGETYVGPGVKIDNLTYVAHNLYIGRNAVITAGVVLLGSSRVEEGAWIAPNSSVLNRVTVGRYSKVGMGSVVTKDVPDYSLVYGNPARIHERH